MSTDRRNATVVVALVVSLTIGTGLLLLLEQGPRPWYGNTALTAEWGAPPQPIHEVEVVYAPTLQDVSQLVDIDGPDSICLVHPDREPYWESRGPRVRLVVVGSEEEKLTARQKETLLKALLDLSRWSGQAVVPVRLAPASGAQETAGLLPQALELRDLLVRKRIIP